MLSEGGARLELGSSPSRVISSLGCRWAGPLPSFGSLPVIPTENQSQCLDLRLPCVGAGSRGSQPCTLGACGFSHTVVPRAHWLPFFYPLTPPAFPDCGGPGWHENGQGWRRKGEEEEETEEGKEARAAVRVLGDFAGFQNKAATWLRGVGGNTGTHLSMCESCGTHTRGTF